MDAEKTCGNCKHDNVNYDEKPCCDCRNTLKVSDPAFLTRPFLWAKPDEKLTLEEKSKCISEYCANRPGTCNSSHLGRCPLYNPGRTCHSYYDEKTEKEVAENYEILFGKEVAAVPDPEAVPENITIHAAICDELKDLYLRKNTDYGDSFHKTFIEEGMAMSRIRLSDKLERFKRLTRSGEQNVKDESVRDTLIDLANYAIMTIVEMERVKND